MTRDDFNTFCWSLPAATYAVQWHESDVCKVGGKVFTICDFFGAAGSTNDGSDELPGITFKTSETDHEILRDMPGLHPAPYLASRGMKWIQCYN